MSITKDRAQVCLFLFFGIGLLNPTGGRSADRVPGRRKRLATAANHCGATPSAGRLYYWTLVSFPNRERKKGDEEWGEKQTTEKGTK